MPCEVKLIKYKSQPKEAQEQLMINQAMDFIFTDSLAFAINATLGTLVRTKLCNYSWEQRIKSEPPTKEMSDRQETSDLQPTNANY